MAQYISMHQIMLMCMLQIYVTNSNSYCASDFKKSHLFIWPKELFLKYPLKFLGRQFLKHLKTLKETQPNY